MSVARVEMSRSQQQSSRAAAPAKAVLEPKTLGDSGPEATRAALELGPGRKMPNGLVSAL